MNRCKRPDVEELFLTRGRMSPVPTHYIPVGTIAQVWKDASQSACNWRLRDCGSAIASPMNCPLTSRKKMSRLWKSITNPLMRHPLALG